MVAQDIKEELKSFLEKSRERVGFGILGDFCLDRFIFGAVERISPEAPVPVLLQEKIEDRLGCAANVALNIAALSEALKIDQHVFSVVGQDALGEELHRHLQALEGSLRINLIQDPDRPTTLKTRFLAGSHHQLLRVDTESNAPLSEKIESLVLAALESRMPKIKTLIIQDYAKGLMTPRVLKESLKLAKENGVFSIVDPHRRTPAEYYKGASMIKPNVAEAEILLKSLTGKHHDLKRGQNADLITKAAEELKQHLEVEHVLITRSSHGMTWLNDKGQAKHFPALARSVYDVTGAGDTTIAVLGAFVAAGAPIELACALSVAASSVVVAKVGTAAASIAEIQAELSHI
ncbi:hypothetical protein GW916_03665 [bacterium]|nr:hypothetical protein [bacterium]